ncbi:MAG: hypothetical protein R2867_26290 [Caldilineaceae bacterium]
MAVGRLAVDTVPAFAVDERRFLFNPLGIDTQLYNVPEPEETLTALAEPIHTPHPISRLRLQSELATYYGRVYDLRRWRGCCPVIFSSVIWPIRAAGIGRMPCKIISGLTRCWGASIFLPIHPHPAVRLP